MRQYEGEKTQTTADKRTVDKRIDPKFFEKNKEILRIYGRALESYGTPSSFGDQTTYEKIALEIEGISWPFMVFTNPLHKLRQELMDRQRENPYIPPSQELPFNLSLDWADHAKDCFLCSNVAQAYLDGTNEIARLLYTQDGKLKTYVVLPNRYPPYSLAMLLVQADHDDITSRTKGAAREPGKTRGAIIQPVYLEAVIDFCDANSYLGLRNHALDGMSMAVHEHFQIFHKEIPAFNLAEYVLGDLHGTIQGDNFYRAEKTPFDNLVVASKDSHAIIDAACPVLQSMEESDEVFTLFYVPRRSGEERGMLIISPRRSRESPEQKLDAKLKVGMAGTPIHYVDRMTDEYAADIRSKIPRVAEFPWIRYIPW